ncbi:MAG: FG-GAP-like repeat-containing protein [Acidobacteriaceae bacterium]
MIRAFAPFRAFPVVCPFAAFCSRERRRVALPVVLRLVLLTFGAMAFAQTKTATIATLAVTSGGSTVSTVASGSVVTLTATVEAGAASVTTGQVEFCDATAKNCTDIQVLGMAQLTGAGTATLRFRPGIGSHSYKAVFLGTNTYATSASAASALAVAGIPGTLATTTTIGRSGTWGEYTLSATVTESGGTASPTGEASFLDTSNGNAVLDTIALGPGVAGIDWSSPLELNLPTNSPQAVAVGDFNGDGIPDLAVSAGGPSQPLVIFLGNTNGTYTTLPGPSVFTYSFGPIVVADFNGDGKQDMAVLNANSSAVTILLGNGDGTFTVSASSPATGSSPNQLAVGDFNGDGIPDLAVTNDLTNTVLIFLGNGDGTFTAVPSSPAVGDSPYAIAGGDFNGDGILDLAVTDTSDDVVSILLGKGDGTFAAATSLHCGSSGSPIAAADFNGDGRLDLAVGVVGTNGASDSLTILEGNGDGTFTSPAPGTVASSNSISSLYVGDFNADGIPDLVLTNSNSGRLTVFLGNGRDSFTATAMAVSEALNSAHLAVGDLNGDGTTDLVVAVSGSGSALVFFTEPTETATATANITLPNAGQHLVDASYGGDPNYNPSVSGTTPLWGLPPATTTTLTMSSGGIPVTSVAPGSVVTLTATVQAGATPVTQGQVNFCDASATHCTDIHLLRTVALSGSGTATFKFVPGPGVNTYKAEFVQDGYGLTSTSATLTLTVGPAPTPVYSDTTGLSFSGEPGDYSLSATVVGYGGPAAPTGNISFLDTSFGNTALATAALGPGTGGLGWLVAQTPAAASSPFFEAAGDFNGDGIQDLAVFWINGSSEYFEGTIAVTVFFGKGDGTFTTGPTTQTQIALDDIAAFVVAGDFNGDGKTDLAVLSTPYVTSAVSVTTLLGNGDGTFTTSVSSPINYPPQDGGDYISGTMVAADFNGDGKLDLAVVGDYVGGGISILLGNGDGTFTAKATTIEPNQEYGAIATGDFNGDGIPDLIAFNFFAPGGATVFLGKGDGTFTAMAAAPAAGTFVTSTVVGDFNGDGKVDLAFAEGTGVEIALGNGDGTFGQTTSSPIAAGSDLYSLTAGDFNHDGKLDLAVIDNYDDQIDILVGTGDGTFKLDVTTPNVSQQFLGPFAIVAADFNGDGVPDLAMLTKGVSTASILLTQPTQTATATVNGIAPLGAGTHNVDASYLGDSNYPSSISGTVALTAVLAPLVISPAPGTYSTQQTITISESVPGAAIYYEAYGTVNTNGFVPYTGPIALTEGGTETIQAYATETGYQQANYVTANYFLNLPAAPAPAFSPTPGVYPGTQTVQITDSVPGATIYYTTNGTTPTNASAQYTEPVAIPSSETLAATAIASGYSMSPTTSAQYTISSAATSFIYTVAGTAGYGYSGDGSLATFALLNEPYDAAVDSAGNLYIADYDNNVVREVAAGTGIITTVAGNNLGGYIGDGGAATSAELLNPQNVALDQAGDLYIADSGNCVVRKVTAATGIITTYAGNGICASYGDTGDNGPATSAEFSLPYGLAVDAAGDLYVSDQFGDRVREITAATGTITTVAGGGTRTTLGFNGNGGPATSATLDNPQGLALDHAGDLFIADLDDNVVLEVNATSQIISIVAGNGFGAEESGGYSGDGGPATSAELYFPSAVAVDGAGNLYINDSVNRVIREVTASNNIITTRAGNGNACGGLAGDGGPAADASLCYPEGIALDDAGNLYVTESSGDVREITTSALPPTTATAPPAFSISSGTFAGPQSVTLSDSTPGAEIYLTYDGTTPTTRSDEYRGPVNVNGSVTLTALAGAPGYLPSTPTAAAYTISTPPSAIASTVAGNGLPEPPAAGGLATSTALDGVNDVAVDSAGNLYIPDSGNEVVWEVSATTGIASVVAGTLGSYGSSGNGGLATSAQLNSPIGVALDSAGDLYISDAGNHVVREVNAATGIISTYAGDFAFSANRGDGGPATYAQLDNPAGLALDAQNNLYIADSYDGRIRMVSASTGIISTVAGGPEDNAPLGDGGLATSARLWYPTAVTLDNQRNLYIADSADGRVRKVTAGTGIISTLAGNGDLGSSGDGLPATHAEVQPFGLAFDGTGDLFIADNAVVRELAAGSNVLTTIAGNGYFGFSGDGGSATLATFCDPEGMTFDRSGNLLVAEWCNLRIRKVTFQNPAATPMFSVATGTYTSAQLVSITEATPNAVIYYTTDGSAPTVNSTVYNGAIAVPKTETLEAVAFANGDSSSGIATATYTINLAMVAPTVMVAPSSSSITTAQSDQVTVTVSGGNGNPIPTGTVTLSSGSYTSSPATLSAGLASITVPAGQLAVGSDTLTASYIPDSGSSSIYTSATGTAPVTVVQAIGSCTTANPNPNPNPASFAAVSDFNGDCKSDILWRNSTTEQVYEWFMNGATYPSSGSPGSPTSDWVIQGAGDFNGDGKSDILWRNTTTGEVFIWIMNGSTFTSSGSLGYVSSDWSIAGIGDFNGDGKADILWWNSSTGQVYVWFINGTAMSGGGSISYVSGGWTIAGIGDFNGDGKSDLLWRNSTSGQLYIWLINGATLTSSGSLGSVTSDWKIAGVGDFNNDGKSDILWQNSTTGQVYLWLINGVTMSGGGSISYVSSGWNIEGVGDYDGSGRAGILWRNSTTEQVYIWLMNGTTISTQGTPGTPAAAWQIAP